MKLQSLRSKRTHNYETKLSKLSKLYVSRKNNRKKVLRKISQKKGSTNKNLDRNLKIDAILGKKNILVRF